MWDNFIDHNGHAAGWSHSDQIRTISSIKLTTYSLFHVLCWSWSQVLDTWYKYVATIANILGKWCNRCVLLQFRCWLYFSFNNAYTVNWKVPWDILNSPRTKPLTQPMHLHIYAFLSNTSLCGHCVELPPPFCNIRHIFIAHNGLIMQRGSWLQLQQLRSGILWLVIIQIFLVLYDLMALQKRAESLGKTCTLHLGWCPDKILTVHWVSKCQPSNRESLYILVSVPIHGPQWSRSSWGLVSSVPGWAECCHLYWPPGSHGRCGRTTCLTQMCWTLPGPGPTHAQDH